MEHREAELREDADPGAAGPDAAARFLRELRQLRVLASLGHAELAARAHYPRAVIEAAESGPSLPELPVLAAYVRGCGGTAEEVATWEDRWRSVTGAKASPLLPAREAGNSDAASAGARIGAVSAAADSHDPAAIMAALDRFAERMATASGGSPAHGMTASGRVTADGAAPGSAGPGAFAPAAGSLGSGSAGVPKPGVPKSGAAKAASRRLAEKRLPDLAAGTRVPAAPAPQATPPVPPGPAGTLASPGTARTPGMPGLPAPERRPDRGRQPADRTMVAVGIGVIVCLLLALLVLFA